MDDDENDQREEEAAMRSSDSDRSRRFTLAFSRGSGVEPVVVKASEIDGPPQLHLILKNG